MGKRKLLLKFTNFDGKIPHLPGIFLDQRQIFFAAGWLKTKKEKMGEMGFLVTITKHFQPDCRISPNLHHIHITTKNQKCKYRFSQFRYLFTVFRLYIKRLTELYKNSGEKINIFLLIFASPSCMIELQDMGYPILKIRKRPDLCRYFLTY